MTPFYILNNLITIVKPSLEGERADVYISIDALKNHIEDNDLIKLLEKLKEKYRDYLEIQDSLVRINSVKDYYSRCLRRAIELLEQGDERRLKL